MQGGERVSLFPIIQPQTAAVDTALPLYKEIKWDFTNNKPVFLNGIPYDAGGVPVTVNGVPVLVEGAEAVAVWAWKALQTPRLRYEIYSWYYGNDAVLLIGKPFTEELKRAEAARLIRECLIVNPYIKDVVDVSVLFNDGCLSVSGKLKTVYGEVPVSV
jgi:hypothetical protein